MAQKALRDAPADPDPTRGPAASTSCTAALYRGQRFLRPWGGLLKDIGRTGIGQSPSDLKPPGHGAERVGPWPPGHGRRRPPALRLAPRHTADPGMVWTTR